MTLQERADKLLELQIKLAGIQIEMYELKDMPAHAHLCLRDMRNLIKLRSPEQVARMEKERGLS